MGSTGPASCEDRKNGSCQQIDVEPQRPVPDVVGIVKFLFFQPPIAAHHHLPHPAKARTHGGSQLTEVGPEATEVVLGKWTGTNQTHRSVYYVPQLRQFIDAKTTHEITDQRDDAWVVQQLNVSMPLT